MPSGVLPLNASRRVASSMDEESFSPYSPRTNRERVVPEDIMLLSHEGAATSMYNVIKGKIPRGLNGGVRVILNNRENTIPYVDPETKKMVKTKQGDILVKDFTYLTFKKEGKSVAPESDIKKQLMGWIASNVPKTKLTRDMISTDSSEM